MKRLALALTLFLAARAAAQDAGPPAAGSPVVALPQVDVKARQEALLNSIDRKVYNVSQNAQGLTGTAADVLRNIPSVDLDLDGNLSLRGDSNVQVLIDGRTTALMNKSSQADVLSQYPADAIDRIEVITNPSAKYKPDGSAGIINIVLKKKRQPGYSGSVRLTVGTNGRYGTGVNLGWNPGAFTVAGGFTLRQDDRVRTAGDKRSYVDPVSGQPASTQSTTYERARPLFLIGQLSVQWQPQKDDKFGEAVNFTDRTFTRYGTETDRTVIGPAPSVYNRLRYDPEHEHDAESRTTYEHAFGRDDDTLSLEFRWQHHTEVEDDHYTDLYATPPQPTTYDHFRPVTNDPGTEALAEYSNTLADGAKLEAGYDRSDDKTTNDHLGESTDPVTGLWANNTNLTNRFVLRQTTNAVYGTYARTWGDLGAELGLRFEDALIGTDQITAALAAQQRYDRLYPTLHLSYDVSATGQLQASYSHRVNRPESDDFNPYPEYQDPYNLRAGNPNLKPEEAHSLQAGYQYKDGDTTYLGALFYRYSYNGFTSVSRYINSTTLLTTEENLAKSHSAGLEFAATVSPFKGLDLNASGDAYYNQIDASNLGYSTGSYRSTYAWTAKMSADYAWSKATVWQMDWHYTAKRLTPQGYRVPVFLANLGVKHDLKRNLSLVVAVSDLFNSQKEETKLDTPALHDDSTRRRASRYLYAGLIYSFGSAKKKGKTDVLQFEN